MGLFRKRHAPTFENLTLDEKRRVTRRIAGAVRAMNFATGGRYKIVNSPDILLRERGNVEHQGEDRILPGYQRGRLLDMARNQVRNSSTFNAILKQFDLNAVGTVGGKATFTFDDEAAQSRVLEAFAAWTHNADFFDGVPLNALLKIILKTYIVGGDMVLVFDDGLVEDSGRVLVYEPDEIGNLSEGDLRAAYGANAKQSLGRVYNQNGRNIGVIVSRSQRGNGFFDIAKSYTLKRDPDAADADSSWIMPRNVFRIAQGRGVASSTPSLSTVIDLEDLTNYELQAAKKNSQTLAQVVGGETAADPELTSAFTGATDFSAMTDSEIDSAVASEIDEDERVVTLEQIKGAGVLYEAMPDGKKLELLDTKHPNANMPEFIRWLAGRSAATYGLGSVYATLKADASYTAFRGEQVMSWPAFEEAQKFLEGICDWMLARWSKWSVRRGILAEADFAAGWTRRVSWQWPRMREVNQVDEQNAVALKLKNGTGSYSDIYGADWKRRLDQIAEEIAYCRERGIPHPNLTSSAGAVIGDVSENQKENDK